MKDFSNSTFRYWTNFVPYHSVSLMKEIFCSAWVSQLSTSIGTLAKIFLSFTNAFAWWVQNFWNLKRTVAVKFERFFEINLLVLDKILHYFSLLIKETFCSASVSQLPTSIGTLAKIFLSFTNAFAWWVQNFWNLKRAVAVKFDRFFKLNLSILDTFCTISSH